MLLDEDLDGVAGLAGKDAPAGELIDAQIDRSKYELYDRDTSVQYLIQYTVQLVFLIQYTVQHS